ncbi:hypothetical protein BC830DRAFT_1208167 [Chytriomyces sp. MP71]|nr:hypothetical protein BC830DRAFT_1208167 [Chytriomyces sp. MP71]
MDVDSRIKVLTRRITVHISEIPREKGNLAQHLQIRQFIGQDLAALESCFENQQQFRVYTKQYFKWDLTTCLLYISYYHFLLDYQMFI